MFTGFPREAAYKDGPTLSENKPSAPVDMRHTKGPRR